MNYINTRGQIAPIGFKDAVMMGLATDGGLLLPQSIPLACLANTSSTGTFAKALII